MQDRSRFFKVPMYLCCAGIAVCVAIGCSSATTASSITTPPTGPTGGGSSTWQGGGDGVWRRDANSIYGEIFTFDPCKAHQPGNGQYHYHSNPVCLRYQLNDNLVGANVGTASASFTESAGALTHSPLLGWAFDGYPVYGPYGYSTGSSATSAVRRMVSSYAIRTDNTTTRTSLPAWAAAYQGISQTLTSTEYGPAVSATYPLGRYVEDYDYTAGSGDLDQYNGRFGVTPEFPGGTYAYFVTITATGAAAFPYYLGPQFYGTVTGGNVTTVTETTTTYFTNHALQTAVSVIPAIFSWFTKNSSQYAQAISESNVAAGAQTTWSGTTSPVYADVQQIRYATDFVYVNAAGLPSHTMGPWYNDVAKTQAFPNYPSSQNTISKVPMLPVVATTKTSTGGGAQGTFVNGVAMFNMLDFHSWSNSAQADQ
jgi:YHYH protein